MHVATTQTHPRTARGAPARSRSLAPRRPSLPGRDRSATRRQPRGRPPVGEATPRSPQRARGIAAPSQAGATASADTLAVAGGTCDPRAGREAVRLRDRAVDAAEGPRRDRAALRGDVSYGLPLDPAEAPGLDRSGARRLGLRARRGADPGLARPGLAAHQKKARRKGAVIVFIDETGFSFQIDTGTTWAPEGQTPELRRVSKRRQVSTAIGLTTSGRVCKKHFDHAIHGEDTVAHLEHLGRQVRGPKIIIWDRLQAHRSQVVKAFLSEHPE